MVVATILSRAKARRNFQVNWPCIAWSITLYPGPITWGAPKKAIAPTMSPAIGGWIYQVQRGSWRNRARIAQRLGENERGDAAGHPENCVGKKLLRTLEGYRRDAKHRLFAPEPARHHDAGDGGEHDGAEHRRAPPADHLFHNKKNGGDRRVECRRQARRGAYRGKHAQPLAREIEAAADHGGHAGADLQRRSLGPKREFAADRKRRGDEFPDDRPEGDIAVVDIQRGFCLVDAAAPRSGEDQLHQHGDQKATP